METNQIEREHVKRIHTKLKFVKSDKTGAYVSFVTRDLSSGRVYGVRQDSDKPKKICVLDKTLARDILLNVLYSATLIPMSEKKGYVVIDATPVQFEATIETTYVPKAIYKVEVKFGNKAIRFDPKDGRMWKTKTIQGCKEVLEKRVDIANINQVVNDFVYVAYELLRKYKDDGFYVCSQKGKAPQKTQEKSY